MIIGNKSETMKIIIYSKCNNKKLVLKKYHIISASLDHKFFVLLKSYLCNIRDLIYSWYLLFDYSFSAF